MGVLVQGLLGSPCPHCGVDMLRRRTHSMRVGQEMQCPKCREWATFENPWVESKTLHAPDENSQTYDPVAWQHALQEIFTK